MLPFVTMSVPLPPSWLLLAAAVLFFFWKRPSRTQAYSLAAAWLFAALWFSQAQTLMLSSLALAVALGLGCGTLLLRTENHSSQQASFLGALLWGFFLGKLVMMQDFSSLGSLLPFSSLAALSAALLFLYWRSREEGLPLLVLLKTLAPAWLCLEIFSSLGLFLHGEFAGPPTNSLFAVTFPATLTLPESTLENPLSLWQHSAEFAVAFPTWVPWLEAYDDPSQGELLCLPVHPLALYRALGCLLLCALTLWKPRLWWATTVLYLLLHLALLAALCTGDTARYWLYESQWASLLALLFLLAARPWRQEAPTETAS